MSSTIQQVPHLFNLDLRVLATNNITSTEVATGKVAKVAAVTESTSLIDKKLYTLQEVCDFRHSRTYADLKDGVMLLKLFRSLDLIMKMIIELTDMQASFSRTTADKAKTILKESNTENEAYCNQ
ncbi:hypothetical protein BDC45DRAFT_557728 [Circinella umbellata]|nr:hypothetical protein BDC45DRAFT_557728 [Circinella umbellata]